MMSLFKTTKYITILLTAVIILAACKEQGADKTKGILTNYYASCDSINNNNMAPAEKLIDSLNSLSPHDKFKQATALCLHAKIASMQQNKEAFLTYCDSIRMYISNNKGNSIYDNVEMEYNSLMGFYWIKTIGCPDSALTYFNRACDIMENLDNIDADTKIICLQNIADTYKQNGQYDKAIVYYYKALQLTKKQNVSTNSKIAIAMGISSAYTAMGDFVQSKIWWDKTYKFWDEMSLNDKFLYLNNRGNDCYEQKQYGKSRKYFEAVDSLLPDTPEYEWNRMFAKTNLSDIYIHLGMYDKAEKLLDKTEAYFKKCGYVIPLHYIKTQRMSIDAAHKLKGGETANYKKTVADDLENSIGVPELLRLRLDALKKQYAANGDCVRLLAASDILQALNDSLRNNNTIVRLSTIIAKNEHEKQLLAQQRIIDEHKAKTYMLAEIAGFLLMFIIIAALIIVLRLRHQHQHEKEMKYRLMALRMENARGRITPHFIGNSLNIAMLDQMNGKPLDLTPLVKLLRMSAETSDSLYCTLSEELQFIDYYVKVVTPSLGNNFIYTKETLPNRDTKDFVLPSMTLLTFVENAIKHGLKKLSDNIKKELIIRMEEAPGGVTVEVLNNVTDRQAIDTTNANTGLKVVRQTLMFINEQTDNKFDYGIGYTDNGEYFKSWLYIPQNVIHIKL